MQKHLCLHINKHEILNKLLTLVTYIYPGTITSQRIEVRFAQGYDNVRGNVILFYSVLG